MQNNTALTTSPEWLALEQHAQESQNQKIIDLFADESRFEDFHSALDGLVYDYSKNNITGETIDLLCALAKSCGVEEMRQRMISGEAINNSENRAVLHMALRNSIGDHVEVEHEIVNDFVENSIRQIEGLSNQIRDNKAITDIVNIGIGGSDLGPRMVCKALQPFLNGPRIHFISNIDGQALSERLTGLDPKHTLIIVTSKTFTTLETVTNANTAKNWLLNELDENEISQHLYAITMHTERAMNFGVPASHILLMRDWIGGRFSLWSSVGLSIAAAFGFDAFKALLDGAHTVDEHFLHTPLQENIPVLMGLIGIWHRNFKNYPAQAILPYSHALRDFPRYLQQLDMESNGKSVTRDGEKVNAATGPIIFGEAGTNAQHAFMQLLHQSEEVVPADFIISIAPEHSLKGHHTHLVSNALAQSRALMIGQEDTENPARNFSGNRPSSTFMLDHVDPYHLGMLIALYEHKIFVQGCIWGVNSFDQWGVELGKTIARTLSNTLQGHDEHSEEYDGSTKALLDIFKEQYLKT